MSDVFKSQLKGSKDLLFGTSKNLPRIIELRLADCQRNPEQPRKDFNQEAIEELAASINKHGLIQPITVQVHPTERGKYIIVAGERRFRAHQHLGRDTVLAIITEGNADEIALIENIQREDLNPFEEAAAYQRMIELHNYTQEDLGTAVGKKQASISEALKLSTLPEAIQSDYAKHKVGRSLLVEVSRIKEPKQQLALWEQIKTGATIREVRAAKSKTKKSTKSKLSPTKTVLASGTNFVKKLKAAESKKLVLDEKDQAALEALQDEIATLIKQLSDVR